MLRLSRPFDVPSVPTDHTICELCSEVAAAKHDHLVSLALGQHEASMDHAIVSQKEDSLVEKNSPFSLSA